MTDLSWGELWLCPDGLLRRSIGLGESTKEAVARSRYGNRRGPTVDPSNRPTASITDEAITQLTSANKRNRWIRRSDIAEAKLSGRWLSITLALKLRDGSIDKLHWAPIDKVNDLLEPWLGGLGRWE